MSAREGLLLLGFTLLGTGCRSSRPSVMRVVDAFAGQAVALEPKAMPPGETFTGSYVSPHTGKMDLTEKDRIVRGTYSNTIDGCNVAGTLAGRVIGNAALIRWRERRACPRGIRDISGGGQLSYDAPDAPVGLVQLLGYRDFADDRGRTTPWTAVKTPATPAAAAPAGQALDARLGASAAGMALRVQAAGAALDDAAGEASPLPEPLRLALVDAKRALVQAQRAVQLWTRGDGRPFLQVQYCLGTRLAKVEQELAAAGRRPRPGLRDIVPDRPPSTWSDANCPPPSGVSIPPPVEPQ